jgi:hypothetical protein
MQQEDGEMKIRFASRRVVDCSVMVVNQRADAAGLEQAG